MNESCVQNIFFSYFLRIYLTRFLLAFLRWTLLFLHNTTIYEFMWMEWRDWRFLFELLEHCFGTHTLRRDIGKLCFIASCIHCMVLAGLCIEGRCVVFALYLPFLILLL